MSKFLSVTAIIVANVNVNTGSKCKIAELFNDRENLDKQLKAAKLISWKQYPQGRRGDLCSTTARPRQ